MKKLRLIKLTLFALGVLAAHPAARADEKKSHAAASKRVKVVVHVNFADVQRQGHGLRNIENVLKEVGDKATVEVVCHGAGIGLLVKKQTKHAEQVEALINRHVRFAACENTMHEKSISRDDLLPGVVPVSSGALEVVRKQQEGFSYFKP